jgi:hypothetical protein
LGGAKEWKVEFVDHAFYCIDMTQLKGKIEPREVDTVQFAASFLCHSKQNAWQELGWLKMDMQTLISQFDWCLPLRISCPSLIVAAV